MGPFFKRIFRHMAAATLNMQVYVHAKWTLAGLNIDFNRVFIHIYLLINIELPFEQILFA